MRTLQNTSFENKALTAEKLKQQGSSVQEIADKLNVSKSRVYEYLRT